MQTFSFKRLSDLIVKDWTENSKKYVLSILALLAVLGIITAAWLTFGGNNYQQQTLYRIFIIGMFFSGAAFASTSFSMLSSKTKGSYWLTLPATHTEKLLSVLFFNVIGFSLIYFTCITVVKLVAESYIHWLISKYPLDYTYEVVHWHTLSGFVTVLPLFIFAFYILQAAFILGSVMFRRFAFLFTVIIITVLFFGWLYYAITLMRSINTQSNLSYKLDILVDYNTTTGLTKVYRLPQALRTTFESILKYALTPLLWLVTWCKLKEKEI